MLPKISSLYAPGVLPAVSALVAYSLGWWWGRRSLRARIAGLVLDLHDLQANGIHSPTYHRLNQL